MIKGYFILAFFLLTQSFQSVLAQNDSTNLEPQQELWPELNVHYRINDNFQLYSVLSGAKTDESSYSEGSYAFFVEYFGWKAPISRLNLVAREEKFRFKLRVGYLYSTSPPSPDDKIRSNTFRVETSNTVSVSQKLRAYYKGKLDMTLSNHKFNARYVPRFELERDFKTEYLTFSGYTFVERYLDFQGKELNRTRVALGANLKVSRLMDFETYYLHQFSNGKNVPKVKAIGTKFMFYFSRK